MVIYSSSHRADSARADSAKTRPCKMCNTRPALDHWLDCISVDNDTDDVLSIPPVAIAQSGMAIYDPLTELTPLALIGLKGGLVRSVLQDLPGLLVGCALTI